MTSHVSLNRALLAMHGDIRGYIIQEKEQMS